MNDRLTPAEEVFQELQDAQTQLERAHQTIATLTAVYENVREQLCPRCKYGRCSAHLSALTILTSLYPKQNPKVDHEIVTWDWRESVDVDELAQAVGRLSRGMLRIHTIETGTDANGIVITNNSAMTPEQAQQLFEEDSPVLPYANGLIGIVKVDGFDRWSLTCDLCGNLGTWPMVPIVSRSEPEVAWDIHVDEVHNGHGNY